VAELRAVSGLFDGLNQGFSAGATRDVGFGNGYISLFNVGTLFEALFHAFNAVAAGEAIKRQVDSVRHKKLLNNFRLMIDRTHSFIEY
jgi:hypothetical protein